MCRMRRVTVTVTKWYGSRVLPLAVPSEHSTVGLRAAACRSTVPSSACTYTALLGFPQLLSCLHQRCGCSDKTILCRVLVAVHVGLLCEATRQALLLLMSLYQSSFAILQHMLPPLYAQLPRHCDRQCEGLAAIERQYVLPCMRLLSADAS